MKQQKTLAQRFASCKISATTQKQILGGGRYCDAYDKCTETALDTAFKYGPSSFEGIAELHSNLTKACYRNFAAGCLAETFK
jgi:hypothetical protein